jgi:hypothetical protein
VLVLVLVLVPLPVLAVLPLVVVLLLLVVLVPLLVSFAITRGKQSAAQGNSRVLSSALNLSKAATQN